MVESESTRTPFSKVVEMIFSAARKRKNIQPENIKGVTNRIYGGERSINPLTNNSSIRDIADKAKRVYADALKNGQHVTTGLLEWTQRNRFKVLDENPAKALEIAHTDLLLAINASGIEANNWITREATKVKCAEAAQALTVVAMSHKDLRENPYFLFQTAAQLAGSNSNPESQSTIRVFVDEMYKMKGKDGFDAEFTSLQQLLTEKGMGAMPTSRATDEFSGVDFSTLPTSAKQALRAFAEDFSVAGTDKQAQYRILVSYDNQLKGIDTSRFTKDQHRIYAAIIREKVRLESETSPSRGFSKELLRSLCGIEPTGEGDFHTRLTLDQVKMICEPPDNDGDSGIDRYIHNLMRRIFTGSREPRSPDLQEQSEYWEIEQLWRYLFGEERAQAKLAELRSYWESEYRRNAINWHMVRGGSSGKDLITKYAEGIPPDTLQHEKSILWAPEAISALEAAEFEVALERRYVFDEGLRWFDHQSTTAPGHTRLEAYCDGILTGAELTGAKEWNVKIGHGSITMDEDAQFDEPAFNRITNIHSRIDREYEGAKLISPTLTEDVFYSTFSSDPNNTSLIQELKEQWGHFISNEDPEIFVGTRLWNNNVLTKWQGLSPLQIRAMINLEARLKIAGVQHLDEKTWKLSRAISAATRYQVGSFRTVTLTHHLSNMPGIIVAPSGGDVMIAGWQEQLGRIEDPEVFMRRFSIGGENVGLPIWANLIQERLERIGVKLARGEMMLPSINEEEDFFMRRVRTLLVKSRSHYGMGFTEAQRPSILGNLSSFDDTSWRNDLAIWKVLQTKYGEHAKNIATGIQLQLNKGDISKKMELWDTIAKRTPSKLIQLMSTEKTDEILIQANLRPGSPEFRRFMGILSVVEGDLQTLDANILNDNINLGRWSIFEPYFSLDVFNAFGITDQATQESLRRDYFRVITRFQRTFLHGRPNGETMAYREIWARNNMGITVSMTDFDVGLARWDLLPADQQLRRVVSDAGPHLGAAEQIYKIISTPDLFLDTNTKKMIEEYSVLKSSANGYVDTKTAEDILLSVDDAVVTFRKAQDFYKAIRVVPGATVVLRQLAGLDTHKPWARFIARQVRPVLNFIANSPLFVRDPEERRVFNEILQRDIKEWPKNFAQLHLSPAIAAVGPSAPAEDSIDTDSHYDALEHSGLITVAHERLNSLKDKHKARNFSKFIAIGERYWWVPIVATIAVGVIIALQEQGVDSDGKKSH